MSAVITRHLDLKSVQSAWKGLTNLVPLGPITGNRNYEHRVRILDGLLDRIGADESHPLTPLLDLLARQIEVYEKEHQQLPGATAAEVLRYLMEEHQLAQSDLPEIGSQGVVSEILRGKRELNIRHVRVLAARFNVSPASFI